MNRLISFPRSGNHWVRFIIEFLSNRPTAYLLNKKDGPIYENLFKFNGMRVPSPISIRDKNPIFYKQHDIGPYPKIKNNEKVILIIREPKEAIIRHNLNLLFSRNKVNLKHSDGEIFNTETNGHDYVREKFEFGIKNNIPIIHEQEGVYKKKILCLLSSEDIDHYFQLIKFYDDFNGDKLLIRYEDLINKCEDVAKDIYSFLKTYVLQEDPSYSKRGAAHLNDFTKRREYLARISRGAKGRTWIGSASQNDLNYWSKYAKNEFPNINLEYFDEYMFEKYNFLIEKYNIKV